MSSDSVIATNNVEDYAYYASDWIWPGQRVDLMKSMLLFFDKVALALPENEVEETINRDSVLAVPLADKGLLVNIDPLTVLDARTAKQLAQTLTNLISRVDWHGWDVVGRPVTLTPFHYGAINRAFGVINKFESTLKKRGLLRNIKDSDLVQLDPRVRLLVLAVFAQAFRSRLIGRGIIVHPLTDSSRIARGLELYLTGVQQLCECDDFMSPRQLSMELLEVGPDLSSVPLDEILSFRQDNKAHYIAYATGLRQFLVTQAALNPAEREKARQERLAGIREQAAELRKISRSAFGVKSAALLCSLVGAAWTAKHGDILGSVMAGLAASSQAMPLPEHTVTSYSYILKTREI